MTSPRSAVSLPCPRFSCTGTYLHFPNPDTVCPYKLTLFFYNHSNGVKVEELTGADKGKLEALAKTADEM